MSGLVTIGESMGLVLSSRPGGFDTVDSANLSFGGAESNVAIGVARLGGNATWIGRLGDDAVGRRVARTLRAENVRTHIRLDDEVPTALMLKDRPRPGRSRVSYYRRGNAGSRLTPDDVPAGVVEAADVLHVTGIALALSESSAATVLSAVRRARTAGVRVSFDVNHRATLWDAAVAAARYGEAIALSDIVFAGADEARIIVAGDGPEGLASALRRLGPSHAVIKLGASGAVGADEQGIHRAPAFPVPVVDTVGAGDAFVAGYLTELMRGSAHPARLTTAAACGAAACQSEGDWEGLPFPNDVEDIIRPEGDVVQR